MKKLQYIFLVITTIALSASCSQKEPNIPKPRAYPRVDRTDSLQVHIMADFSLKYSSDAKLVVMPADKESLVWFNINYPQFNAILYCSYTKMNAGDLPLLLSDNRKFIFNNTHPHVQIQEYDYASPVDETHGALYYFDGNPISPYQFYLTDSTSYFLRGSLYYTDAVQTDSIRPTTLSLKSDITNLMESFQSKSIK